MNAAPRLSVGLPVYNGEKYLAESLDSLLGQTYEDFELIISDNASTDSTPEICRRYGKQDSRIRYLVQPRNIGLVANHNLVIGQARGELFKWASDDDLYARELLGRCVAALDEYPQVVLAHSKTVLIDSVGTVLRLFDYRVAVDAVRAPERFRSMLFDGWDDYSYGVVRTKVLRRTSLLGSHHFSDRTIITEIGLHGPFCLIPDWLHFRREHADRPPSATVRHRCATMDPRRANRLRHPVARLYAEYVWAYVAAIRHAPLSPADRRECYRVLARWVVGRALPVASRTLPGRDRGLLFQFPELSKAGAKAGAPAGPPAASLPDVVSGDAVVAGRERKPS
jgi:glycosyltransferase involved in cell wall biosynthesis